MVRWNAPFEVEEVEQLALIVPLPTHHDPLRRSTNRATENHAAPIITSPFSTPSVKSRHCIDRTGCPLYPQKRTSLSAAWPGCAGSAACGASACAVSGAASATLPLSTTARPLGKL